MNTSKIKNLILVVLLFVNVAFLYLLALDRAQSRELYRQEIEGLVAVFAAHGVSVPDSVAYQTFAPVTKQVAHDSEAEKASIAAVLGKVNALDQGGGIYYSGDIGEAVFHDGGVFKILLNDGAVPTGQDAVATARSFLEKMNIKTSAKEQHISSNVSGGAGTVVLTCLHEKTEVVNCKVTLTFTSGSLILISGTQPLPVVRTGSAGTTVMQYSTVMMRFLDALRNGGHVCSRIINVELLYFQNFTSAGSAVLIPIWRFTTDSGVFYIDGISGEERTGL